MKNNWFPFAHYVIRIEDIVGFTFRNFPVAPRYFPGDGPAQPDTRVLFYGKILLRGGHSVECEIPTEDDAKFIETRLRAELGI
jgi:hypothetical protein